MVMSYFRRAYSSFVAHVFDIPSRLLAFLLFLILLSIPLGGTNPYYLGIMIQANIFALFAASWDLLVGRTGLISLGHALFFGIGGYSTALLFELYGLPIWATIPLALIIGSLVAFFIGLPCLRVKGPYLALVTMAFPIILGTIVRWTPLSDIFHSELGIRNLPAFFPFLPGLTRQTIAGYYFTLILLFISAVILYKIANSKTGLVFISILDDEVASKACGINVTKYKILSFIISGFFGTLAGVLYSHTIKVASPPMFALTISILPIIVTFLGGIGTIYGPILGIYIYYTLDNYVLPVYLPKLLGYLHVSFPMGESEQVQLLIFSVIVLVLVIKWPRGLTRVITDKLEDLEKARDLDERGPRIWKTYKRKESTRASEINGGMHDRTP